MIRRFYTYLTTLFLVLPLLHSCVYPYTPEESELEERLPVFDGRIVIGDKAELNYSVVQPLMNDSNDLTGYTRRMYPATFPWWVEDEDGKRYEPGENSAQVDLSDTDHGKQYRLCAQWEGQIYASEWMSSPEGTPVVDDVEFIVPEDGEIVQVSATLHDMENGSGYVALSFEEAWEFHAEYRMDYEIDPVSWIIMDKSPTTVQNYWCWNYTGRSGEYVLDLTRTDGKMKDYTFYIFSRRDTRCHRKYSILVHLRSISEQEYRFMKNLDWTTSLGSGSGSTGNLFTPNPGEIPGNIRCLSDESRKAYGYVSISNSSSKRFFLNTSGIQMVPMVFTKLFIPEADPERYEALYNSNYRPVMDTFVDDVAGIGWGPLRCIDCVAAGGTLEKPDYWQ